MVLMVDAREELLLFSMGKNHIKHQLQIIFAQSIVPSTLAPPLYPEYDIELDIGR